METILKTRDVLNILMGLKKITEKEVNLNKSLSFRLSVIYHKLLPIRDAYVESIKEDTKEEDIGKVMDNETKENLPEVKLEEFPEDVPFEILVLLYPIIKEK